MNRSRVERRRAEIQRIGRVAAQDTWVMGRLLITGIGEVRADIPFPVRFGEKPLPILGGGEYASGDSPESGRYPTCQGMVIGWDTVGEGGYHYRGATLGITVTGRLDQRLFMTFAFVGTALTNMAME